MKGHKNLVILAGGASSRMKKEALDSSSLSTIEIKQANERSKGLIALGDQNRPLLDYVLFNAKKAGYKNIFIVIGENGELFKDFYGTKDKNNSFQGLNVSFAVQYIPKGRIKPFGTADALLHAVEQYPALNQTSYSVCNSDNLYSKDAFTALRQTLNQNAFIAYDRDAMEYPIERISRFALAKLDASGYLLDIIEKPKKEEIEKYRDFSGKLRVSMNAFNFIGNMIYPYLKNCPVHKERGEKELPNAVINMLRDHPKTVNGIPFSENVPDLTVKDDILIVKKYLEKKSYHLDWNN